MLTRDCVVYGAYGYNVRTKIDGYTDWAVGHTDMYRYDPQWPLAGYTYSVQVQTSCGDGCAGDWTAVGSVKAVPQTAAAPKNHKVSSTDDSITITFDGAVGDNSGSVTQYDVSYWDQVRMNHKLVSKHQADIFTDSTMRFHLGCGFQIIPSSPYQHEERTQVLPRNLQLERKR